MRVLRFVAFLTAALLTACGGEGSVVERSDDGNRNRVDGGVSVDLSEMEMHLALLSSLPEFQAAPPQAHFVRSHRDDGVCVASEEPDTWREYTYEGEDAAILDFYKRSLAAADWREVRTHMDAVFRSVIFERDMGSWKAEIVVATNPGTEKSFDLSASVADSSACQ